MENKELQMDYSPAVLGESKEKKENNDEKLENVMKCVEKASGQTQELLAQFGSLKEKTEASVKVVGKTDAIIKYIQSITTQMTLLGFNASIEAKRVGAAGEGFNVIAQEVRKLSDQTASQTTDIENVLKEIKDSIKKIEKDLNNASDKLAENVATIDELQTIIGG